MGSIGVSAVRLIDGSGDALDDDAGKLNVNATLVAGATIDIGDVDMFLDGGVALLGNTGSVAAGVLRVTIADDDNVSTKLTAIETDTDYLANIAGTHDVAAPDRGAQIHGQARLVDGGAFPFVSHEGDSTRLNCSIYGVQFTNLTTENGDHTPVVIDDTGQVATPGMVNVGGEYRASATTYTDGDAAILQSDINGYLKIAHGITGGADGVTTDDTSGQVLGGDVACRKIDIQAQTDNTGVIAVGFTGVDATVATGTGILLYAGDVYSLEINNLNLIYIESSESGEGVRYTYFT